MPVGAALVLLATVSIVTAILLLRQRRKRG
jgi:uncharacterized membrane protein